MYNPPPRNINSNANPANDISFNGVFYAFPASGGFLMEQAGKTINMLTYNNVNSYDVTNSVQVSFDVRVINSKLGVLKDDNNLNILSTSYNDSTGLYPNENISITAGEFVNEISNVSRVISVGIYNSLYKDFVNFVNQYFRIPSGFTGLFSL